MDKDEPALKKVPLNFPIRSKIPVRAPAAMTSFICAAERCEWTCCHGWRIPVDPAHATIYTSWTETDGTQPFAGFLRCVRVRRAGKLTTESFLDLPAEPGGRCRFLSAARRCRLQERFGEDALCDSCALFPRRLIQFDKQTWMTVSLACPETIRELILTEKPLTLTTVESSVDLNADWLDTDQVTDKSLREVLSSREEFLTACFRVIYDPGAPFHEKLSWLCSRIAALNGASPPAINPRPTEADLGAAVLSLEKSFNPPPDGFAFSVSDAVGGLLGSASDRQIRLGAAFSRADRSYLSPFFESRPRWFENYLAAMLYADALTEINAFVRPDFTLADAVQTTLARLVLSVNLLTLRLAASARAKDRISKEIFMRSIYENDRNFFQSPTIVENVLNRYAAQIGTGPIVFSGDFLNQSD